MKKQNANRNDLEKDDREAILGHTAAFYHVPTFDKHGISCSLRRLAKLFGLESHQPDGVNRPGWPNTEYGVHYLAVAAGFEPVIIGTEKNFSRNRDDNVGVRMDGGRIAGSKRIAECSVITHPEEKLGPSGNTQSEFPLAWK